MVALRSRELDLMYTYGKNPYTYGKIHIHTYIHMYVCMPIYRAAQRSTKAVKDARQQDCKDTSGGNGTMYVGFLILCLLSPLPSTYICRDHSRGQGSTMDVARS